MAFAREATWCESAGHTHVPFFVDMIGVDRARNTAVSAAVRSGCDLLLFQDADTFALPQGNYSALARLVATLTEHDAAVVGAAVVGRSERMNCDPAKPGEVYEGVVGTALMLLDLHKLARVSRPWFLYQVAPDGEGVQCGEDLYFCRRAAEAGCKVVVDYGIATGHVTSEVLASAAVA